MLTLSTETSKGKFTVHCPQSWNETSVEQYQRIIGEWDGEDWIQLFSILSGLETDSIQQSKDGELEGALYECIQFVFKPFDWTAIKTPEKIRLQPIWLKDCQLIPDEVFLPKKIGRLSIGQAIQARKSLEGVKDLREGMAKITAIYLQPLIDAERIDPRTRKLYQFDMLRVIEIESIIEKMSITKVYPIGFFLLRKLNESGKKPTSVWSLIKNWMKGKPT